MVHGNQAEDASSRLRPQTDHTRSGNEGQCRGSRSYACIDCQGFLTERQFGETLPPIFQADDVPIRAWAAAATG